MIIKKIVEDIGKTGIPQLAKRLRSKQKILIILSVSVFFLAISVNPLNKAKNSVWADEPPMIVSLDQGVVPKASTAILSGNGVILPVTSPLFVTSENYATLMDFGSDGGSDETIDKSIIRYTVQKGETLSKIAEKFNISTETILLSNELSSSKIKEGQELIILPINGLMHMVEKGETIESIAKEYDANPDYILEFNNLGVSNQIFVGDVLVIPNGKIVEEEPKKPSQNLATKPKSKPVEDTDEEVPTTPLDNSISSAYFINPAKGVITQGAHYSYTSKGKNYYTAVDIGGEYGSPIVAAAAGTVQIVKNKWPYGMYITISHANGSTTLYSHLSSFAEGILPGVSVSQGQIIGYMGNTGHVIKFSGGTGTHLHYEVRGATNPLIGLPVGRKVSY